MNNIKITTMGNIVKDPIFFDKTDEKPAFSSFRLAVTPSYYSKAKSQWINGESSWFDVKAYGSMASHINQSVKKGDPVIVTGDMRTQLYEKQDGSNGSSNVIIASAVGHNLTMGNTSFTRGSVSDEEIAQSIPETTEIIED